MVTGMKTCDKEFSAPIVSDKSYTSVKYLGYGQEYILGYSLEVVPLRIAS